MAQRRRSSTPSRKPTITSPDQVRHWAQVAAGAADDKKATDTVILDVSEVLAITDLFVITSGGNSRQVRTIADEIEQQIKDQIGMAPLRTEGRRDLTWVLLDYGALVVHVFSEEMRRFYDIERLYRDVPQERWLSSAPAPKAAGLGAS